MGNAIVKLIEVLVSELFSELLTYGKNTFWIKLKHKRFNKALSRWVRQFINGNDGTVLTTGDFERYLSYHRPIDRLFDAIIGNNPCGTKEKLIEHLISRFKAIQSEGKTMACQDEMVLKELFVGIYERIDCFYRLQLSDADKYIIAEIRKAKSEIIESQEKGNTALKEELTKIHEVLKEGKEINTEDARWIYEVASKQLTEGSAETIYVLLPLLNENTGDLQYAVPYLIQLMSNYEVSAMPFSGVQKCIKDEEIYTDLVRKTIYYSLVTDNIEILNQVDTRNADLKSIAENLLSNNYGAFFNQTEEIKNGIKTIKIEVQKNYPNEHGLVLRISAVILSRSQVKNAADVVTDLMGNDQTIVEKIIYFDRRTAELQCANYNDSAAEKLYQELTNIRKRIDKLPDILQIRYFITILRAAIQISAEKAKVTVEDIPQQLRNSKEIESLCMQVKIMNGEADLEQVVQLCVQNDQYWLFNNYLIQFKEEPARIKDIIECHKFILTKDVSVFLLYVQVISMNEGKEKGKEILESYEKHYSGCLEYWVEKVRLCPQEEANNILTYIQNKKDLCYCTSQTRVWLIQLLYDFGHYEDVLTEIEHEEAYSALTVDLVYIKAMTLLKSKKEIEALDVFSTLFTMDWNKDETIFYLLVLSNKNNREVEESVLKTAEKSISAKVLLCLSNYYERHQNLALAERLLLRSMFYGDDKLIDVYGHYLRLHNTISQGKAVACDISDVNTVVRLVPEEDETDDETDDEVDDEAEDEIDDEAENDDADELVYCIHNGDVLPKELFEWEGGRHIYKDTAIRMGLYRKRVGDTVVVDNTRFTIAELLSLDCFLFRVSMQKMIDAGEVKCIHMAVDDQEKIDVEAFKKELLENVGEQNDEQQWLTFYKDMSAVPVTLFFAKQFVRVNYLHLTLALLRDTDIVMREFANKTIPDGNQFILSFTTIIALHELGFDLEGCSADLFISASSLKEIDIEVEQIVSDNSRERVASMGVHDGQLYFNESSEEAKQTIMQNAVAVKSFAHKFKTIDNKKDLEMEEDPQFDCKEFFGICDYDTVAIAAVRQYTLVAFEAVITAFSGFSGIDAKSVGIAEFLAMVCDNPNRLVDYTRKMLEFRFMLPFTSATIKKLCALYEVLPEQEQVAVYEKWEEALSLPLHDEKYKSIIAEQARKVYLQTYGAVDSKCPIWRLFTKYALQYLGYKFQYYVNSSGRIAIDLVASDEEE